MQNNTNMEQNLERIMEETVTRPGVFGCLFADHHGLCLGTKGKVSPESSGIITAIAQQALKLEPHSGMPIIKLETNSKQCLIQSSGTISAAIYKNLNN